MVRMEVRTGGKKVGIPPEDGGHSSSDNGGERMGVGAVVAAAWGSN